MSAVTESVDWELMAKRVAAAAISQGYVSLVEDEGIWWFGSLDSEWSFPVVLHSLSSPNINIVLEKALREDALFRNAWESQVKKS